MNQLTDIAVHRISLVDKASVRDPKHPDQPRRFLLVKKGTPMATSTAAAALRQIQSDHTDEMDSDVRDRLAQIASLLDERAGRSPGNRMGEEDTALAKCESALTTVEIAKRDPNLGPSDRIALTNASRETRLEFLRQVSPQAARAAEKAVA